MARVPNVVPRERAFRPLIRAVRRAAAARTACPACGSPDVRRSLRRSFLDIALAGLLLAPFRCRHCRIRFYRMWRPAIKKLEEATRAPVLIMPRQLIEINPVETDPVEPIQPELRPIPRLVEPPPSVAQPLRFTRSRSVLILESDLSIRKLLRRLLDRRGYFTHEVGKPEDLPIELRERRVDLLILDAALMGANGLDRALAFAHVNPDLKVLALSLESLDQAEVPERCLALTKPFSLETFLESVDRLLEPAIPPGDE
jgi:CheY-like chemotaxis protein